MHAAHRVGLEDEFHSQAVLINRDVDCVIRQDPRSHTYLHKCRGTRLDIMRVYSSILYD